MIATRFINIENWNVEGWTILIIIILAGLGLFLYGINRMSTSLKSIAGDRLKTFIKKTTDSPILGILVGILVTILIQSSSGTTALIVGLVGAGLMTLPQAIGVIMGANIGTTFTVLMLGLPISDYFIAFVVIGSFVYFFSKKKKTKEIGQALFGFGIIFLGLSLMSQGLKEIFNQYTEQTTALFEHFSNVPFLGFLLGTGFTALIQSSAASLGILQTLYSSHAIKLVGAIAILIGSNVGTTITAILSAIGGTTEAKRTALVHTMFNLIGAILFMIILYPFSNFVSTVEKSTNMRPELTIAFAHIIFNVLVTFILFFFRNFMAKVACTIVKSNTELNPIYQGLKDYSLIKKSTNLALEFVSKSLNYMINIVSSYFDLAYKYSFENIKDSPEKADKYEKEIDLLYKEIHEYLIKITQEGVEKEESNILSKYLDTIKDLERIGDHLTNIVEFFEQRYSQNLYLSDEGITDLKNMLDNIKEMIEKAFSAIITWNKEDANIVINIEQNVDNLEDLYRKRHILRINEGKCDVSELDYYVDILSNLERIGDHADNIANNVINDEYMATTITGLHE